MDNLAGASRNGAKQIPLHVQAQLARPPLVQQPAHLDKYLGHQLRHTPRLDAAEVELLHQFNVRQHGVKPARHSALAKLVQLQQQRADQVIRCSKVARIATPRQGVVPQLQLHLIARTTSVLQVRQLPLLRGQRDYK